MLFSVVLEAERRLTEMQTGPLSTLPFGKVLGVLQIRKGLCVLLTWRGWHTLQRPEGLHVEGKNGLFVEDLKNFALAEDTNTL